MREVDPDLPPVRPRHRKDRLAVGLRAPGLGEIVGVDPHPLVAAHRGQHELAAGLRPALEMRHLVDWQFLLPAPVSRQHPHRRGAGVPQIQRGQPVLAEQPRDIGPPVAGDQRVIGKFADALDPRHRRLGSRQVGDPGLAGVPQAEHEPPSRRVDQADGLRPGWYVGHHLQRVGVEHPHPARVVVRHRHQFPVVGNRPADGIARLDHPRSDRLGDDIDLRQPAVASENIGKTLVGRIDQAGVRQIPQPLDPADHRALGLVDQQQRPGFAFHDQTQIAGRANFVRHRRRHQNARRKTGQQPFHDASPSSR